MLQARDQWYHIVQQLHRFMIAVSRVTVNHDGMGGSAPDPVVWDHGSNSQQRRTYTRINVDLASLPGPPGLLNGPWVQVHDGCITGAGVAAWPYSVSIFCKFTFFFGTLHWPAGAEDLGHFGLFLKC